MKRGPVTLMAAWVGVAFLCLGAVAQEGILTFRVEPSPVEIAPGGTASGRVAVRNGSAYEADDVAFLWTGPAGLSLGAEPQSVSLLAAFASTSVPFALVAEEGAAATEARGSFEVVYTYCIGEVCFQIVESIPVLLKVTPATQTPSATRAASTTTVEPTARADGWRWGLFGLAAGLVLASTVPGGGGKRRTLLALGIAAAGLGALVVGVETGQHTQAQAIGAVLCTSCVGIETVEREAPRLSVVQEATIDRLTRPVNLLVFYAPWCRSCPYAEAMVDLAASRNPLVRYRLVNAEIERDLAAEYGVTRAGRTVVPAIVRIDTGRVLFGADDLGNRLTQLLEEGT